MHPWGACPDYDPVQSVLLYLVLNEVLTWVTARVPAGFGAFDETHFRRGLSYNLDIYDITYVSATVAQEDADSRFGGGLDLSVR